MLSYQHLYHAGNLADVQKHALMAWMLDYLTQKDKPLSYIETHAGRGLYDLSAAEAVKTGEAEQGIGALAAALPRRIPMPARWQGSAPNTGQAPIPARRSSPAACCASKTGCTWPSCTRRSTPPSAALCVRRTWRSTGRTGSSLPRASARRSRAAACCWSIPPTR